MRFYIRFFPVYVDWMLLARIVLLNRIFTRLLLELCSTLIPDALPDKTAKLR